MASKHNETLIDLGLTKLEAEVYLSLHVEGKSNATEISRSTRISRPDVYRILSRLQEDSLIEKEINYPNEYKAIPIQTAVDMLLKQKSKKLDDLRSKTDLLLESLKNTTNPMKTELQSKFIIIPSRQVLIKKLKKAIDLSKKTIEVSTSSKRFFLACNTFSGPFINAWSRGVKGRVVIEEIEESILDNIRESWKSPFAEIKYLPTIPTTIIAIFDKKEVFLVLERNAGLQDSDALWSNNPNLLSMANDFFEKQWITAMPTPD